MVGNTIEHEKQARAAPLIPISCSSINLHK